MPPLLDLSPDDLLSTTRAVRRRLDLDRPVEPELIRECVEMAAQAPTGSNAQGWHFVVVTDADKREKLAEMYREGFQIFYGDRERGAGRDAPGGPRLPRDPGTGWSTRPPTSPSTWARCRSTSSRASRAGSRTDPSRCTPPSGAPCCPAAWNFCLAARARGLGTCWTTLHLIREQDAAELLGLPENVMQGALIPVAHTKGTDFKPGPRRDLDRVLHLEGW